MNIYVEIMSIYGITFLVSMFVAFIIWGLAKLVDILPEEFRNAFVVCLAAQEIEIALIGDQVVLGEM